jgi:hypothetical protein
MKVTCTLTVDDCIASSRSKGQRIIAAVPKQTEELRRQRRIYWTMAALTIGGSLLASPGSIYLGLNVHFAFFAVTFFALLFCFAIANAYYKSLTGKTVRATFAANEKSAGPYTVEASPAGLTYTAPYWRSEVEWSAILRVLETGDLLLIVDDTPRTMIVPKRAFASAEDADAFVACVTRGISAK